MTVSNDKENEQGVGMSTSPSRKSPRASKGKSTSKAPNPKRKSSPTKAISATSKRKATTTDGTTDGTCNKKPKSPSSPKKRTTADHQRITDRDAIPKLWDAEKALENGSYTFKIASFNVAGLRAFVKKEPNALADLCTKYDLDMLCLQETKLQEVHLDDPKLKFRGCLKDIGFDDHWSCSTGKKGYSGTAVFVKQYGSKKAKQKTMDNFFAAKNSVAKESSSTSSALPVSPEVITPSNVSYGIGHQVDIEGRTITLEYPFATITNVYVPNAGQTLDRLTLRTNEWDKDFLAFQQVRQKDRKLPVIWLGDLNIAHKAYDVWNNGAKHLDKQAGVTPQERASFQEQLDAGYVDAFRKLHPEAKGHYSYWSMRAGNREPNKGLRLDYFICSPDLFEESSKVIVRDCYMITHQQGSDHCPVVLELEVKQT